MGARLTSAYRDRQRTSGRPESSGSQYTVPKEMPAPYTPRPTQTPVPANDNNPVPANDNSAHRPPVSVRQVVAGVRAARGAIRFGARASPWGRVWNTAEFVYNWWEWDRQRRHPKGYKVNLVGQWCLANTCPDHTFNKSLDKWGGAGGASYPACNALGTACLEQAACVYDLPVRVAPLPNCTGTPAVPRLLMIGGKGSGGGIRAKFWFKSQTYETWIKYPKAMNRPADWVNADIPAVQDPWFLPINRPVTPPTRSPTPSLPPRGDPIPGIPERSTGTYGTTSTSPNPSRPVPRTRPRPPQQGEKEKKGAIRKGMAQLLELAYAATEVSDLIDAVYQALPKRLQKKGLTPQGKAVVLYRNADQIDLNQAVLNIVKNHFTDAVIGRANALADEGWKSTGVTGYGAWDRFLG